MKYRKYSTTLMRDIHKAISDGLSIKDACRTSGVSEASYYNWTREHNSDGSLNTHFNKEFCEEMEIALIKRKRNWLKKIISTKQGWQKYAFLLERRYPGEFVSSTKQIQEHVGKAEQVITVNVVPFIPHGATPDQLKRIKDAYGEEAFTKGMEYYVTKNKIPQLESKISITTKPLITEAEESSES